MHAKLEANRPYANKIVKKRSATVELVLGTLINFLNMKKINSRGMAQANKHVLMAALTYNLKKLMKFSVNKVWHIAQPMTKIGEELLNFLIIYPKPKKDLRLEGL